MSAFWLSLAMTFMFIAPMVIVAISIEVRRKKRMKERRDRLNRDVSGRWINTMSKCDYCRAPVFMELKRAINAQGSRGEYYLGVEHEEYCTMSSVCVLHFESQQSGLARVKTSQSVMGALQGR